MDSPYKDPVFISAQAVSMVAIVFSLIVDPLYGFVLGSIPLYMLQLVWCCKMKKGGLITAGVFAVIAAIGTIAMGNSWYGTKILAIDGGCIWLVVAILVFVFACGSQKFDSIEGSKNEHTTTATAHEVMIPTDAIKASEPTACANRVTASTPPNALATVVGTPMTSNVREFDEESWGSEGETVCNTERNRKSKPDGSTVDIEIQTFTHRDQSKTSVKTVRLSKQLADGNIKEKITIIKTDAKGQQSKTSEMNVIPAEDV